MERIEDDWRDHGRLVQLGPPTCHCRFSWDVRSSCPTDARVVQAGSFALEDLCLHPECIEPLRGEVEDYADPTAVSDLNALPLLDSFLKESSRLSVSDAVSVRRKALQDSDHFNGTHISKGDWVCAAQRAIMHDSDRYADPERFDGFRFVRARHAGQEGQSNRFTDTKPDWLIWGYGNTTWCV